MNVERFSLDLDEPLATATATIESRDGFLIRCQHRGESGIGEATPLPGWTESVEECADALAAAAVAAGDDARAALRDIPRSATATRHGLSTALLDADAKADGLSLGAWLDETEPATHVPVNATVGDLDPATTADRVQALVDEGFDCCKVKVGARPVPADLDRIDAIRATVGDALTLRVDANGNWSNEEAERALDGLDEHDVSIVEQPLPAEDLRGLAALRGGSVDIAVDESLIARSPAEVVGAGAADVLVLKPMVLGGPGEAHTIGTWARERGLDVVVTTTVDAVVARTAAVHVASSIPDVRPCGLATGAMLAGDLGPDPAPVADGMIAVPDGPGLGIDQTEVTIRD